MIELKDFNQCHLFLVHRPRRRLLYRPARLAADYFSYCGEYGCDWEKELNILPGKLDTAAILTLPPALQIPGHTACAAGVELELSAPVIIPSGYQLIELADAWMLYFVKTYHGDAGPAFAAVETAKRTFDPATEFLAWAPAAAPVFNFGADNGVRLAAPVNVLVLPLLPQMPELKDYLICDREVDFDHPAIRQKAKELFTGKTKLEIIQSAFTFVRDQISHSYDIQNRQITRTASEVLLTGHGICYAKSMLLAALLRSQNIPCGFCYQKLTLGDTPDTGYCIHALNAVYLPSDNHWQRLDCRGNTNGRDAQFIVGREQLAFPVRCGLGEKEYRKLYHAPHIATVKALAKYDDAIQLIKTGLPVDL